ncbi:MAG TPA: hypothetical protein VLI39_10370 [Sedimentisphaerales bacterium]|nr:hypothetical protein [Sedimentisphaerales bacterium]
MERWLNCEISPGQFTGEYAVKAFMFDNTAFSLFAPKESLKYDKEPSFDRAVQGQIKIVVVGRSEDLCLVNLPRPTFENGRSVTVKAEQIR